MFLAVAPVLVGELPLFEVALLAGLETLQLLVLGDVHPELAEHHALIDKRSLVVENVGVGAPPLVRCCETFHALDEHPSVPGAVEHDDPTPSRQFRPEALQPVMSELIRCRSGDLDDTHVPGVHRSNQALDRTPFAGGVPSLEDKTERWADLAGAKLAPELEAELEDAPLSGLDAIVRILLLHPQREIGVPEGWDRLVAHPRDSTACAVARLLPLRL